MFPAYKDYSNFHEIKTLYSLSPNSEERKAFNRFHNTLALLAGFDSDADFSTGIDLVDGVSETLDGVIFALETDVQAFSHVDPAFFYYRNVAFSKGEVATAANRAAGTVADAYYSTIGSGFDFSLPTYETADYNQDGVPERVEKYSYDARGNRILEAYSNTGSGPLIGSSLTYDEYGRVLTISYDADGDGVNDSYSEYEYSVAGNLVGISVDSNADGDFDRSQTRSYEFQDKSYIYRYREDQDGDGITDLAYTLEYKLSPVGLLESVLLDEVKVLALEYQSDGTLVAEHTYRWTGELDRTKTYDDFGRLVSDETFFGPFGPGDGYRWDYTYDAQGNRVQAKYQELGLSPNQSFLINNEFDESGNLLEFTQDFYLDGSVEQKREYIYDEGGNLTQEKWYEVTQGGQVTDWPSKTVSYSYNEQGLVSEKFTEDYTYDAPDDPNGGKERTVYQYDPGASLTYLGRDSGADGSVDYEFKYDLELLGWRAALEWAPSLHQFAKLPFEEKLYSD
ncbi:hypothetical protein AWR36_012980 [Microbulbifer flavimaris]|uniref:YD repeat-containing protein n=1 Tax=Microbulbifer flavimaris TaxID=1781068 RepID=A0ABX4HW81_9GAMM|nr:hypothetical protein AVO43_12955 [Microbulbifer sp. ZGT114]PCO04374.1 hypothetical protein AWR36_012980 [Microbulbifer flavimaris]